MTKRPLRDRLMAFIGGGSGPGGTRPGFPPAPAWRPSFGQPLDQVRERLLYYSDHRRDFVILRHGTCVILESGTEDDAARDFAIQTLANVIGHHPDMTPTAMDDDNLLVRYNYPAVNVVLTHVAREHWDEVESRYQDGLVPGEVLVTPLGPNRFDDAGKMALLGRAYMFMDAQDPVIVGIERV